MNNLDKQSTDLIGDCYKKYYTEWSKSVPGDGTFSSNEYSSPSKYEACNFTKEEFINKIKTDDEFAKKWGLTIEERELKKLERINIAIERKLTHETAHLTKDFDYQKWCDEQNIPTKSISLTYDNQTIEIYE
jgi:hypothetical protein